MKKNKMFALTAAAMLCAGLCVTSCGDDPVAPSGGEGGEDGPVVVTDDEEVMSPAKQKQYLEEVGLELNSKLRAEDFRHYTDLADYVGETYGDDYEWDNIGDWAEDILDGLMGSVVKQTQETEKDEWTDYYYGTTYTYLYNYYYNHYKSTILASNFLGHWTARNGKWTYTKADDLQFIFQNEKGQQCVLKVTTSGKVTKVHMMDLDDETKWESLGETAENTYSYNEYYDRTEYTIGVPEKIEVTLTEGGTTLISQTLNINLASLSGEEFDLSKSSMTFSSETKMSNGYMVKVENTQYTAKAASTKATLTKNNEVLITATLSTNLANVPKVTLTSWYDLDDDELEDLFDKTTGQNAIMSLDVLGKVQLKGTITDVRQFIDFMDTADDNDQNESAYKRAIVNANTCFNIGLYYNGGKTRQAQMLLEPFKHEGYDFYGMSSSSYWDCEPILVFGDNTSYSLEEYFNEKDFKALIDALEEQEDVLEDMFGGEEDYNYPENPNYK